MRTSHATLLLLLLAAGAILAAGWPLSRRDHTERLPVARENVEELGARLQAELARLAALYEKHLADTAEKASLDSTVRTASASADIHGIRQCVFLPASRDRQSFVVPVPGGRGDRVPDIVIDWDGDRAHPPGALVIDAARFLEAGQGWAKSGNPAFGAHWVRRPGGSLVAFVVDWRDVAAVTNAHLVRWVDLHYGPVRASGDLVSVEGPAGALIAGLNQPPGRRAELVLPFRYRFGFWQILAWDRTETRVAYDTRTLAVTCAAAGTLAILGVLLFRQQQRALRLAEERVSFVNRVSHELGTPLTNALLNVDLAAEAVRANPDFSQARLRLVTEEMQRLARLVANVLTFSRRERGTLELKAAPCVPDDIVDAVLRQFEPSLTRRGIRAERNAGASQGVRIDPDALAQIVGNLVSNVEKYAAGGGWFGCETAWEDGALTVRVADRGPGIPASARERIFEPFERVGAQVNEGASGTGLGLAIARDLAARMGGTLALAPSDTGAIFELRVPAPPLVVSTPQPRAA